MTVYALAAELEDFPTVVGTASSSSLTGARRSANSRIQALLNVAAEDTNYCEPAAFAASEFWTKVVAGWAGALSSGASNNIIKWYAGGTQRLAFRWLDAAAGTIEIRKWNGSSWDSLATATDDVFKQATNNSYHVIDVHIKLGNPGEMRVYFNDIIAISRIDLDLTWSGVTELDKVRFNPISSARAMYISEVMVTDWPTILGKLVTAVPDANGNYTQWAGTYTNIDEASADSLYISSGTADQRSSFSMGNFPALGDGESIAAVKVTGLAQRDAAGPQNINLFTRISSTDYDDSDKALNVSATKISKVWETSPATAAAWTVSELNAAEFGVRSRA